MATYYIGQIVKGNYGQDLVNWCDAHNAYVYTIGKVDGVDTFEIKEIEPQPPVDVDTLTMTAWDFVNVLKTAGLTSADILEFLNANPDIQLHLTCCQNVYCGVAKSLMPITYKGVTITAAMVEQAFKDKYGV